MRFLISCGKMAVLVAMLFWLAQRSFATDEIIPVTTTAELRQALKDAQPGQTIALADGLYQGAFEPPKTEQPSSRLRYRGRPPPFLKASRPAAAISFIWMGPTTGS